MVQGPNPLSDSELEEFQKTAEQKSEQHYITAVVLPNTGQRVDCFAHMKEEWLHLNGTNPHIDVPRGERCDLGADGGPCNRCRNRPNKDWAPDWADFSPKTKHGVRKIPIRDPETIELLRNWYAVHDRVGVVSNTISKWVRQIERESDINRDVIAHDLRDCYGTMLADNDFTAHQIKNAMGHGSIRMAEQYIDLSGKRLADAFDRKLGKVEDIY